ncbi:MAG: hypothetical protein QXQ57_04310 [Sulfolobales archaeon]
MSVPGLEAGIHVFFALLAMLCAAALISAIYVGSTDKRLIRILSIALSILVWLTWFSVIPVYTIEYPADRACS